MDCGAPRHGGQEQGTAAEPGASVCAACKTGLRRDLRRLPGLDRELGAALERTGRGRRGGGDGGLPYHEPAAECMSQIRHDLAWWAARVLAERQPGHCPVPQVPALCGWLSGWVTWIAGRRWAGDMCGALAADRGRAIALLDPMPAAVIPIPAESSWCPRCGARGGLSAVVWQHEGDRRASYVTCAACLHEWDAVQWLRLGRDILNHFARQRPDAA